MFFGYLTYYCFVLLCTMSNIHSDLEFYLWHYEVTLTYNDFIRVGFKGILNDFWYIYDSCNLIQ